MRIHPPSGDRSVAEPGPAFEQRGHPLGHFAPSRDLHDAIQPADDSLDALPRRANAPPDPLIRDPKTYIDEDGEFQVAQFPQGRALQLLRKDIGERELVDEDLFHGVLSEALWHRPFVQKSPDRRPLSLLTDKPLNLMEIAWIPGMNRTQEDTCPKAPLLRPRFQYRPCHHHTRALLSTEVKIQDDVFYSPVDRGLDGVLRGHRTEQLGRRPALVNP